MVPVAASDSFRLGSTRTRYFEVAFSVIDSR